jgi:ribosomal protein S18 acetylase RimI-like enzyme
MDILDKKHKGSAKINIELTEKLNTLDLMDLSDATEATMLDTYAFSIGYRQWSPPIRDHIESYFKGIMLVPERKLIVARVDGTIVGSLQLILPHESNQTSNFIVSLDNHFVAPWARSFGIGKQMLVFAEDYARSKGYEVIKLSVRSIRDSAITLYESSGYKKWGTMNKYERIGNNIISGHFYSKDL